MNQHVIEHPVDRAARLVGGRPALADLLGVTQSAIGNWKTRGVPFECCVRIEALTSGAVTRKQLRPDDWEAMWPELASAPASTAQAGITAVAMETTDVG